MSWTVEQKQAIENEGNMIVSAAAGSGKTAVLTERIISRIEAGQKITDMLVVTFTNAAAEEMKRRIESGLFERASKADTSEKKSWLYSQATNVSKANISTLHAFCLYVLRRHFYEIGLSPAFRVADETETNMLIQQSQNLLLEQYFTAHPTSTDTLLTTFGSEEQLLETIMELYQFTRVLPDGNEWLDCAVSAYNTTASKLEGSDVVKQYYSCIQKAITSGINNLREAYELCSDTPKICTVISENLSILLALERKNDFTAIADMLPKVKFTTFVGKGSAMEDKERFAQIKALNSLAKKGLETAVKYCVSLDTEAAKLNYLYPIMCDLKALIQQFDEIFTENKANAALVDFSDLEQYTLRLLLQTDIAELYKNRFAYVYVDEYQDINPLQNSIIDAIARHDNLFFVGDIKQSIYRFRHAEPKLFLQRLNDYSKGTNGSALNLNANFRSSNAVLDFTNEIFYGIMSTETGEIDYDNNCSLKKMGNAGYGMVELEIIEKDPIFMDTAEPENEDDDLGQLLQLEVQAVLAARHIRELMNSDGFYDCQQNRQRKYMYSDFAVIMRKVDGCADTFARVFAFEGIPVYFEQKGGYYDALEVKIFINLLSIIDNRRQDIPLLSIMRSPIGGFSVDELVQMRCTCHDFSQEQNIGIFDCLQIVSKNDSAVGDKARTLLNNLDKWYNYALTLSVEELIAQLLDSTGYYCYVSALPGGKQRALNLDSLKTLAYTYQTQVGGGLNGFLHYEEFAKGSSGHGTAQDGAADIVRIMTAHKSKGLEFNVVILPSLESRIISVDPAKNNLLTNTRLGIGLKYNTPDGVTDKSIMFDAIASIAKTEQIADEMRLLYVELTRARDRLILITSQKSLHARVAKYHEKNSGNSGIVSGAVGVADWIIGALCISKYSAVLDEALLHGCSSCEGLQIKTYPHVGFSLMGSNGAVANLDALDLIANKQDLSIIDKHFAWEYPYSNDFDLPSKCTVTGMINHDIHLSYLPTKGNTQSQLSAIDRGIATHIALEHIEIRTYTPESIMPELERITTAGFLTCEQMHVVDTNGILRLFESELGLSLIASDYRLREREFMCRVPASDLFNTNSTESILLQGVIDCCFLENGTWTIIDYKTDSVEELNDDELETYARTKHASQLFLYSRALEKITNINVSAGFIYFTKRGIVRLI